MRLQWVGWGSVLLWREHKRSYLRRSREHVLGTQPFLWKVINKKKTQTQSSKKKMCLSLLILISQQYGAVRYRLRWTQARQSKSKSKRKADTWLRLWKTNKGGVEDPLVCQNQRPKGCTAPFHWCIINLLYINITYHNARQVNYSTVELGYQHTPSKPNRHARIKLL